MGIHIQSKQCLFSGSTKLFVERNKTPSKTSCIGDSEMKHSHSNGVTMSAHINLETVEVPEVSLAVYFHLLVFTDLLFTNVFQNLIN